MALLHDRIGVRAEILVHVLGLLRWATNRRHAPVRSAELPANLYRSY